MKAACWSVEGQLNPFMIVLTSTSFLGSFLVSYQEKESRSLQIG
jgi:hypothetical protein